MKRKIELKKLLLCFLVLGFLLLLVPSVWSSSEKPNLTSESAFLIDNKTGKVLYAKEENRKMYPASTTKILTAILALENCALDEMVTVSYHAYTSIPEGYSSAFLQVDEQLTVEQLLELLLVHSANDAANVLAEHIGGSIESFVSMMNTKINELGLSNTHFTNAFGMHDENHYTTAYDLATMMQYCIKNETFRKLSGKASCAISATNKYGTRRYTSTNELLVPNSPYHYSFVTCGKTGYTSQAGGCLVSCSYQDNLELICVVLGGKTQTNSSSRFTETKNLYQYGYDNYMVKTLLHTNDIISNIEIKNGTNDTKNLDLLASTDLDVLLESSLNENDFPFEIQLHEDLSAPIEENTVIGKVCYQIDGIEYQVDLIASHSVEKSKLFDYLIDATVILFILWLIYWGFLHKKKKKQKRKKVYRVRRV